MAPLLKLAASCVVAGQPGVTTQLFAFTPIRVPGFIELLGETCGFFSMGPAFFFFGWGQIILSSHIPFLTFCWGKELDSVILLESAGSSMLIFLDQHFGMVATCLDLFLTLENFQGNL